MGKPSFQWVCVLLLLVLGCGSEADSDPRDRDRDDDELNLPPDPGEAGKATLVGIDSNDNNVRDDVEIGIAEKYPSSTNVRNALNQLSTGIQTAMTAYDGGDTQGVSDAAELIVKGVDCVYARAENPQADVLFVEQLMVNTDERSAAYTEINQAFSGQFFGGDNDFAAACAQ